ncbi:uncharacterized protein LOC131293123 [Anopheles ziemanni]|uniref:uncharacterized protein LOC131264042 n=1 Tax=Anopheles coustani TaxID=139045 RepID=UPI002659A645|nr:uncharacterized protein LOC131264042 [Anopheles coustani]XP_058177184.1 uncharacterized protein LOC131293123 [Anopheles ziemanni]
MAETPADLHYKLQLPDKLLIKADPHDVVEVKHGQDKERTLFIRKNRMLLIYNSSTVSEDWTESHRVQDFFSVRDINPNYPWAVYNGGLIVVRTVAGLEVHKWSDQQLTRQFVESKYNDALGYGVPNNTFLFGKIYPSEKYLGIITRVESDVQFRSIALIHSTFQLKALKQNPILSAAWTNNKHIISLVKNVTNDGQLSIALRTASELQLFRFDEQYSLKELTTIHEFPPLDSEYDRILFAKFNSTHYNDLLDFSTEGLTVYRYNETLPGYQKLFYSTAFSKHRGWNRCAISTITTHDTDGDGLHEMVYSGPNGLSVTQAASDELGFDLHNVLDEVSGNQAVRFALPKQLLQNDGPSGIMKIILHTPQGLTSAEILMYNQGLESENNNPTNQTAEENVIDSSLDKLSAEIVAYRHRTSWLHDQLDLSSLLQPLNPHTGSVELTLPLINLRTPFGIPVRKIFQYKNVDYSNELGQGWSFPLDYIALDRYESAFPQDHVYSLVKDNQRIILTRVYDSEDATTQPTHKGTRFIIEGYPDIKLLHLEKRNLWEVTIDKRTLTYIAMSQFMTNLVCSKWPLCGSRSLNNLSHPTRWYLSQERDSAGRTANYFYKLVKNGTDIRLKSIDLHDDSMVNLGYDDDRISSLEVLTMKYKQVVQFHYDRTKNQLLSITQDDRPLFEFDYDAIHRISKIVYPNGVEWKPEYKVLQIDPSELKKRIDFHHDGTVFNGPDYIVIVDAKLSDGVLTLHIRDPLGGVGYSEKTNATETVIMVENIKRYLVYALADLLVVSVIYDTCKDIAILQYIEGYGWEQRQYYSELPLESTLTTGNKFVLLADTKTLRFIAVKDGQLTTTVIRSGLPQNFVVYAFPHGYATYDGQLKVFVLQDDGHWITLHSKREASYFDHLDRFLNSFEIKPDLRQSIRRGLMADMLGSYRQAIVLKVPVMRGPVLDILVRFFTMDFTETPKIIDHYTVHVPYANMIKFSYSVSTEDKDTFVLGYRLESKKYHLYVKQSSGPHKAAFDEELKKVHARRSQLLNGSYTVTLEKTKKAIAAEYARIYKAVREAIVFAIDLSLFGILVNREGVLTSSHLITYDGKHWNKQQLDENTLRLRVVNKTLNDQYRLVKVNASDTFKIINQTNGAMAFDTRTTKPEQLQLIMPYYAQAQASENPVRMYFFNGDQKDIALPANEQLNSASNQMVIITTVHVNETTPKMMLFRCVKYFLNPTITVLGGQTLKPPGDLPIVTGYQYDVNDLRVSVDGTMFRRIRILPGANTTRFGWYEQSVDLSTGKTTRRAFSANGQPVIDRKLLEQERKQRESEQEPETKTSDLDKMILDLGGRMQIVDLGPYRLLDEMVSYYGFETYEANHFGKENRWIFNNTLIKREENNRFLRLSNQMHTLTGQFMPLEPNQYFVVSCWMRTANATKKGDHLNTLSVDVLIDKKDGNKLNSKTVEVKQRIGDWSYVETILNTTHIPPASKPIFVVIVAPSSTHSTIDIDHIRFSPLGLPFQANIFEPITGDLQAVLGGNGLLKSYLHNTKGKKSILFGEYGEVLEFTMESKVVYARTVSGARPSLIEMKPRQSFFNRFDQKSSPWRKTGRVWLPHKGSIAFITTGDSASIEKTITGSWTTLALRFLYSLAKTDVVLKLVWGTKEFHLPCGTESQTVCPSLPNDGEILVFITAIRISIWVDGVLVQEASLADGSTQQERVFRLHATGGFEIGEFIEMYDPRIKVTYHNLSGQPTQLLVYEDPETVRVREILYDSIERPILQTKWTKIRKKESDGFFAFYEGFITNFDNDTLLLNGAVAELNPACEGYPYTYTVYGSDPSENKRLQGLPGKQYGVLGKYKREYLSTPSNVLLNNLFPSEHGFNQKTTIHPGGAIRGTVEDSRGNKVASYSKVGNYEDRLSTFRYGQKNNKIEQELPPMYHSLVRTASMVDFFESGQQMQRDALQKQWEVRYNYDEQNRVIRKRTPDGGIYQYLYDRYGILRFSLHKDANDTLDRVLHFMYASDGKITREALVNLTETECTNLLDGSKVLESTNFIDTLYGEQDTDPNLRYRSRLASRHIDDDQMTEYLVYDQQNRLLKKMFVVNTINTSYSIDYEYENDELRTIKYPIGQGEKPYKFIFGYNGHGEVTNIKESATDEPLFQFTYNADGMMETMKVRTGTARFFQRNFTYNEPGFLVKLADDFLTEDVSYVETDSYGQDSYTPIYEGLISRTVFTAHWQRTAGSLRTSMYPKDLISNNISRKQAIVCFDVLKQKGYLNENNAVNRTFYGERDDDLPFICGDVIPLNHLSTVLSSGSFPHLYGHRYDYDDHDQLIKAKYFHGSDELQLTPLTYRSFAKEIDGVKESDSKNIWDALLAEKFLSADCTNPNLCHGRPGPISMFGDFIRQHRYHKHLQTLFSKAIVERKALTGDEFNARCKRWIEGSNMGKNVCRDIKNSLNKRNLIGNSPQNSLDSLSETFRNALNRYKRQIPEIVRVLSHHFATALGRSAGDVQSYEIDANGNHRMFYTGFSRYRLEYRDGTNQITKLHRLYFDRDQREEEHFNMEHNSDGAVVKAEHKGIKHMEYDKILHRVTKMEMTDGRKLIFQYDVRAERTFKQVHNPDGTVSHEKYYIRDTNGLVLVDMELTYLAKDQPPDVRVTSYIYKDQQLVGFVRNDKLYGVISDHEGSVRLIVRDGEVVAAYDYLPYGQIFRRYGTDLDGQISYLYTGQEWEPEIGLYNYRARLYDPDIGRFYQMDPKEQYPSPYVYAGNSPVSLVDPDGEFAFAIACLIMAIVGAYIGASSAAKSWNPLQWNWKSKSLWLGLFGGALTGLSIPFNITASVGYFVGLGLSLTASISIMVCSGITFGYFALAAASGSWDPRNFDFTSPGTWNALLGGIATSAFIVTTPNSLLTTFRSISTILGRALFVTITAVSGVTFAYLFGVMRMGGQWDVSKWDFTDPGLYYSLFDGLVTTAFTAVIVRNIPKDLQKWNRKIGSSLDRLAETQIFFRARRLMRGDWSFKLKNVRLFISANAQSIARLQRGILPIAFYGFIVTLRMAESFDKSPVPGMSVFLNIISTVITTRGFSNRIVKPLVPKAVNAPLALRLESSSTSEDSAHRYISSGSATLSSFISGLRLRLFEWLRFTSQGERHDEGSNYAETQQHDLVHEHQRKHSQTSKHAAIKNCYRVAIRGSDRYFVKCFSLDSTTSIHPKPDAILEAHDTYRRCVPLTYDGTPAISCDGERSSLLSAGVVTPKLFDFVDGWLLLARITPAAIRETGRIFGRLFGDGSSVPIDKPASRERHRDRFTGKLLRLQTLSGELHNEWKMDWVAAMVEDVYDDVSEYLARGRGSSTLLFERLDAIENDIQEEMVLHRSKQSVQCILGQIPSSTLHCTKSISADDKLATKSGSLRFGSHSALISRTDS